MIEGIPLRSASTKAEPRARKRWRFQYSIRALLALVAFVSLGMSFCAVYFQKARLDGDIYVSICACGLARAKVSGDQVILAEPRHDRPAGAVVATIEIADRVCTLRWIGEDGAPGPVERLEVDHLGATFYDEEVWSRPVYILMDDNWKLYPAMFFARVRRLFG